MGRDPRVSIWGNSEVVAARFHLFESIFEEFQECSKELEQGFGERRL